MSGEQKLSGPDLAAGIADTDLADGALLLGHAGGEAVLLARQGDSLFAVAASCSHYGGPLAEGLLVGHTVRCPWHHACFDLRTGEAVRAPALNAVACFDVESAGGRIRVGGKREPEAPAATGGGPASVVIVGAGAAGNAAAERLRRLGFGGGITLVGIDPDLPYDRPNLSKDYLAGNAPEDWIPLHPREFYDELRVELRLGQRAAAIDPSSREVRFADGSRLSYGSLLLATGAEPIRLAVPGGDLPHVHTLRTLADSRALIAAARGGGRAVVVGASFIGLEVAASLRARGVEVTVVAPDSLPLSRVLGPELGHFIRGLHEEHGVAFRLGEKPSAITPGEVHLAGGGSLPAELVVVGIGVRPAVALAEAAGLALDRGVAVDRYLETSVRGIFAAGDIARWPDPHSGEAIRVEHWVVAERQGQIAAENILGRRQAFDQVPFFWSQHYDVPINYVGHAATWDETVVHGSLADRNASVEFRGGGKVRAVATVYRDRESLEAELAMERRDPAALAAVLARQA
jgi:NADPH-dependent 2,4-dienoyl-CoA reductase/sulfur reductase-like enzyme/nitrite reductase/ring-hydroxylating ferredoxin subunit